LTRHGLSFTLPVFQSIDIGLGEILHREHDINVMGFFNFFYRVAEGVKKQKQGQKQRSSYFVRFWVIVSRHIVRYRKVAKTKVISLVFFLVTFCRKNFWFSQAGFNDSFFVS
jgi:hypothetical protein